MQYKKKTLKNGMRIIVVPMKDTNTVTVMSLVSAGSKYETKFNNGISHFLEHMCFKGTTNRPTSMDINRELDGLGAQSNAFTSEEFTGYYAKAEAKHLNQMVDIISDMYLNPIFPKIELEKEKGVILQEISMYEDLPQRQVGKLMMKLLYGDQPAGMAVLGPSENIKKMKRQDFVNYRAKHYVARATMLVVSGKCDPEKVFKLAEKAFKDISKGSKNPKKKVVEVQKIPQVLLQSKATDQTHMILGFRAFGAKDKRSSTLSVLSGVLGAGMSSRLFHKLREEMGVCYYVKTAADEYTDHGILEIRTGVDRQRVLEVIKVLLVECHKLKTELVSDAELRKVKDFLIGNLYLALETSDSFAEFYGIQEIIKGDAKTADEIKTEIEKVTAKDILKLANQIIINEGLNLAIIGQNLNKKTLQKILKLPSVKK